MTEYIVEVLEDGSEYWHNKALELHREGGLPAIVKADGYKAFLFKGKYNNDTGPAKIWPDGECQYWINGEQITKEQFYDWKNPARKRGSLLIRGVEFFEG